MLSIILIIKFTVFYQLLLNNCKIMVLAIKDLEEPSCTGKHQMGVEKPSDIFFKEFEAIQFVDFDKMPSETILENDSHMIMIHLTFKGTEPTIKVNFEQTLGVKGSYRLHFLYFKFFEEVPTSLAYENITFSGEFHALFYNVNANNFTHSLTIDRDIIVLAFQVQVNPLETQNFDVLQDNLKYVQEYYSKTLIPNYNLEYWIQAEMQKFYIYEGSFQYNCEGKVIYIDFTDDVLQISPEIVKEFQKLKACDMTPLMNHIQPTVKPRGKVYSNSLPVQHLIPPLNFYNIEEPTSGASAEMPGLIFSKQVDVLFVIISLFVFFY